MTFPGGLQSRDRIHLCLSMGQFNHIAHGENAMADNRAGMCWAVRGGG